MDAISIISNNSSIISLFSTIILVIITGVYVYLTKKILDSSKQQINFMYNPLIGVELKHIIVGQEYSEYHRRNLEIDYSMVNIGNAAAIGVMVDSEIELRYNNIKGHTIIPARFEPEFISFIRPDQEIKENPYSMSFGNTFIEALFNDFKIEHDLNMERIIKNPTRESYDGPTLRIFVYYKNNLDQYYKSMYEVNLSLRRIYSEPFDCENPPKFQWPNSDEIVDIFWVYVPRPKFSAMPISKKKIEDEISSRNTKRKYCGW